MNLGDLAGCMVIQPNRTRRKLGNCLGFWKGRWITLRSFARISMKFLLLRKRREALWEAKAKWSSSVILLTSSIFVIRDSQGTCSHKKSKGWDLHPRKDLTAFSWLTMTPHLDSPLARFSHICTIIALTIDLLLICKSLLVLARVKKLINLSNLRRVQCNSMSVKRLFKIIDFVAQIWVWRLRPFLCMSGWFLFGGSYDRRMMLLIALQMWWLPSVVLEWFLWISPSQDILVWGLRCLLGLPFGPLVVCFSIPSFKYLL